jgi:hypothetical protein
MAAFLESGLFVFANARKAGATQTNSGGSLAKISTNFL